MMRRWRQLARLLIASTLFSLPIMGLTYTVTANATSLAQLSKGEVFAPGSGGHILMMVFGVIMGLFTFAAAFNKLLVVPLIDQMAAQHKVFISETLTEIGKGFEALMLRHINAHDPHPDASDRMHGELEDQIEKVGRELEDFVEWCKRHRCGTGPRDPKESPFPKRETDPEGDFRPLRGAPK